MEATFVANDIYQFGNENTEEFDIVFTSYDVICWLPDLNLWAKLIANSLAKGGEFHLIEFHTFNDLLNGYSYFPRSEPDIEDEGTYTENCDGIKLKMATWPHSLSEVINALISVGLIIEYFKEYPYSPYNCFNILHMYLGLAIRCYIKISMYRYFIQLKHEKPSNKRLWFK